MTLITIDLRQVSPSDRHPSVFRAFDKLGIGDSVSITVDHNPLGLLGQFRRERPAAFRWDYLKQGPEEWTVAIWKTSEGDSTETPRGGCCGGCGGH